jgi:hypothetical protein
VFWHKPRAGVWQYETNEGELAQKPDSGRVDSEHVQRVVEAGDMFKRFHSTDGHWSEIGGEMAGES